MYNKLFTKILDSSIWLESDATRIVWMTLIAAMDETGFCSFASAANLAHRARVNADDCAKAVSCLESPDPNSSDPDNEGRRIERVPGGWLVLNAGKYRELVTRAVQREKTRIRVQKFREKASGNADVTQEKRSVTPSEAETEAETDTRAKARIGRTEAFERFWKAYPRKVAKENARKSFDKCSGEIEKILGALEWQSKSHDWTKDNGQFIPHPATWLNQRRWEDDKPNSNGPAVTPISPHNALSLNRTAASSYRQIGEKLRMGLVGNGEGKPSGDGGAEGDAP